MRIRLKRGYQKHLILKIKRVNNFTWKEFAKILNLNKDYLRTDILNEKRLLSEENFNILNKMVNKSYNCFIIKKLENDWGQSKGGINSTKKVKLLINNKSKELAEIMGIILGDGNIWIRRPYYYLSIVGNEKKDEDYLLNYVMPLVLKVTGKKMNIKRHKTNNELFIYLGSKDLVYSLIKYGLKSGDKIKNNVGIPNWIYEKKEYVRACIRGLFDTDGCVFPITGRNYSYIWFSSNIDKLRKDFDKAMKILGIKTSKWNIRKNRTPEKYIASKEMIEKYTRTISFKNKRNLDKIMPL